MKRKFGICFAVFLSTLMLGGFLVLGESEQDSQKMQLENITLLENRNLLTETLAHLDNFDEPNMTVGEVKDEK